MLRRQYKTRQDMTRQYKRPTIAEGNPEVPFSLASSVITAGGGEGEGRGSGGRGRGLAPLQSPTPNGPQRLLF